MKLDMDIISDLLLQVEGF